MWIFQLTRSGFRIHLTRDKLYTGLEEAQARIKIAERNINNSRYADDTTLMAESEEELKSLLMKVKEESDKAGLNIQKSKIMASGHWMDWCWSWSSNTLVTWSEELTHLKRPWCWERLKGGGEGDDRGWDGLIASPTQWTWVWVNSGSWWWTGKPGVLRSWGHKELGKTEQLNWTELSSMFLASNSYPFLSSWKSCGENPWFLLHRFLVNMLLRPIWWPQILLQ